MGLMSLLNLHDALGGKSLPQYLNERDAERKAEAAAPKIAAAQAARDADDKQSILAGIRARKHELKQSALMSKDSNAVMADAARRHKAMQKLDELEAQLTGGQSDDQ